MNSEGHSVGTPSKSGQRTGQMDFGAALTLVGVQADFILEPFHVCCLSAPFDGHTAKVFIPLLANDTVFIIHVPQIHIYLEKKSCMYNF